MNTLDSAIINKLTTELNQERRKTEILSGTVFPVCAGMNRISRVHGTRDGRVPRVCGDEPERTITSINRTIIH